MSPVTLGGDLSRGRDNPRSRDAFDRISIGRRKSHLKILNLLRLRGPMTSKELAHAFGVQLHAISGRLTELQELKEITVVEGERRLGCAVYRVTDGTDQLELGL